MGEIESYRKGQAIHRPTGFVRLQRSALTHLAEGKMTPQEWTCFTALILLAGWEPRRPNFGKVEANASRLAAEWLKCWTRQYTLQIVKSLIEKGYVQKEGDWWVLPNYGKYNAPGRETIVSQPTEETPERETIVTRRETIVTPRETIVSRPIAETGAPPSVEHPLKEVRNKKEVLPPVATQERDRFSEFLEVYPWCPPKDEWKARQEWDKLKPDDATVDHMLYAITVLRVSEDWQKESGKFIPVPSNFLKGRYFNKVPRQKPLNQQPARKYYDADYENERSALRDNIARIWVNQGRFVDRFQAKRELDNWTIEQMREEFRRGTA